MATYNMSGGHHVAGFQFIMCLSATDDQMGCFKLSASLLGNTLRSSPRHRRRHLHEMCWYRGGWRAGRPNEWRRMILVRQLSGRENNKDTIKRMDGRTDGWIRGCTSCACCSAIPTPQLIKCGSHDKCTISSSGGGAGEEDDGRGLI